MSEQNVNESTQADVPAGVSEASGARGADRLAALIVGVAAVLLGIAALRPAAKDAADAAPQEVGVPKLIEPIGVLDEPPTRFTWTPGGDDVDVTQVVLYGRDMRRLWETGALDTNVATIPLDAYSEVGAGHACFWRVREVSDGKARASSAFEVFAFRRDLEGSVREPVLPTLPGREP